MHNLSDIEYLSALEEKLNEEVTEYQKDKNIEEMADVLEVLQSICIARGYSLDELEAVRKKKAAERGGFSEKIFLESVDDKHNEDDKKIVAGVIKDGERVFATARGYGEYKGWWEFPGGKIEAGETAEDALVREIQEELDSVIEVQDYIDTIEYDYPEFHLSMQCFFCKLISGELILKEAEEARWLTKKH